MRPEPGLTLNVVYQRCRDADTVEVRVPGSAFVWAIRLIDVWAQELRGKDRESAFRAMEWLDGFLRSVDPADLFVHIPPPKGENLLRSLTFDRIPGYLWAGDTLVNDLIVERGYASSVKGGAIGE